LALALLLANPVRQFSEPTLNGQLDLKRTRQQRGKRDIPSKGGVQPLGLTLLPAGLMLYLQAA
jgi:hypothetical protein